MKVYGGNFHLKSDPDEISILSALKRLHISCKFQLEIRKKKLSPKSV